MPAFLYEAVTKDGIEQSGEMFAINQEEAAGRLQDKGLYVTSLKIKRGGAKFGGFGTLFSRVSLLEKALLAEQLSSMLKAGLPLADSLDTLIEQTKNRTLKKIIIEAKYDVESGQPLSDSLENHPEVFPELFVRMVRVGELSGGLEKSLRYLADQLKKEQALRSKIIGALAYPAVVVLATIVVGILMMLLVVPKVTDTLTGLDVKLPWSTRALIAVSNFFLDYWIFILIGLVIFGLLSWWLLRVPRARRFFGELVLKIPVLKSFFRDVNVSRFSRTLANMVISGVPIVESLRVVGNSTANYSYRKAIRSILKKIKRGVSLTEAIEATPREIFPSLVVKMVSVGEKTGELSSVLGRVAGYYEEEVDRFSRNVSAIIEPVLMIIVGLGVAIVALSIISPIYSLIGSF